ncbi:MAG TPA: asparagine synthase (glutamine-hydrolyzing) [Ferruginibacter sp.]|nr:asparagine synthase (glutamine-hydrolyzing) [Ferruginibacter sp.]
MCRIAGIFNKNLPVTALQDTVQKMCDAQKHGGPDDEGLWSDAASGLVLGHRRLSLLDLSSAGHQPMIWKERYVISFNGEIYNFLSVRNDLIQLGHSFKTQTDTEVILAAYEQWGTQSFAMLQGMFAFALWDIQLQELLLVRDAAGIKPLYYHCDKQRITFASETRAFNCIENVAEQNPNWPVYMLAYGHLPEPITTLKNVKLLPKGFYLHYKTTSGEYSLQSFMFYSFSEEIQSRQAAREMIGILLRKAVKDQLISDAPIGVFLSGGIDSGILFLLAAEIKKQGLNSLSLYFNEGQYSEKAYQDILLEQVNCQRNQYLLNEQNFAQHFERILQDMDQPSCDGINTWFISRYARQQGLKAVLSGIGADELLGGYPSFKRMQMAALLQRSPNTILRTGAWKGRKLRRLNYLSIEGITGLYLFLRGQFSPHDIARQLDATEKEVWQILNTVPVLPDISAMDNGNIASWMELNLYMQNQLLRDADVMSMAHGIEIRVPFLDHRFQQYCMQVHPYTKFNGKLPKSLLVEAFANELPRPVWDRPKMGFSFPFTEWFKQNEMVKQNLLSKGTLGQHNYQQFLKSELHWSQVLGLMLVSEKFV